MTTTKTAHEDLHSEHGAVRGDRAARSSNPVIKVEDLAWLEFEKPDLDAAERFAHDFGFVTAARTTDTLHLRGAMAGTQAVVIRQGAASKFVAPVFRATIRLPGAEDKVLNAAWPAFSGGPLVACPRGDRAAGRLLPQPRLNLDTGTALLDEALGDGFAVLYRGPDRIAAFDAPTRTYFEHLGTTFIRVADATPGFLDDSGGALNRLLDDVGADALLLRPDHIVAATATSPELRVWKQQLERAGISPRATATHRDTITTNHQGATP